MNKPEGAEDSENVPDFLLFPVQNSNVSVSLCSGDDGRTGLDVPSTLTYHAACGVPEASGAQRGRHHGPNTLCFRSGAEATPTPRRRPGHLCGGAED